MKTKYSMYNSVKNVSQLAHVSWPCFERAQKKCCDAGARHIRWVGPWRWTKESARDFAIAAAAIYSIHCLWLYNIIHDFITHQASNLLVTIFSPRTRVMFNSYISILSIYVLVPGPSTPPWYGPPHSGPPTPPQGGREPFYTHSRHTLYTFYLHSV